MTKNFSKKTERSYYPFGMPMQSYSASGYRFGFNGQEKETELNQGVTSAEYWMYDGRLGRRWNVDPKPNVSISSYACLGNNPIFPPLVVG